jgi:ribonuclease P protein component
MKKRFSRLTHADHKNLKSFPYKTFTTAGLRVFVYENYPKKSLAVIVPKKKVNLAVGRYALKRSIREVFHEALSAQEGCIVVVVQNKTTYSELSYLQRVAAIKSTNTK